jgi:hypothetical protein
MLEGRLQRISLPSSEGNPFPIARWESQARTWANYISDQQALNRKGTEITPPPWLRHLVIDLDSQTDPPPDGRSVREYLFNLAKCTQPYLNTQELNLMWAHLADRPGYEKLSRYVKKWFLLHYATALRNADNMAKFASDILVTSGSQLDSEEVDYLLAGGLCAYLSMGEKQKARLFKQRFFTPNVQRSDMSIELQLLVSHIDR